MQHSPGVGRTLGDLGLGPAGRGCRVVAIVRGGRALTTLDAGFKVQAGDTLVLLGAHREIDEALERLAPPERTAAQAARGWPGEDPPDET